MKEKLELYINNNLEKYGYVGFQKTRFSVDKSCCMSSAMLEGIESLDEDFIEAYEAIGKKRGALSRGGVVDYERVSVIVLQDFKNGAFGPITFDRV